MFSKVYENKILGTLEPKLEPSKFIIPCGRALKSEKSMFFEPVSLNLIENLIFKLLINPFVKKRHKHFFKNFRITKIDQLQNDVSFVLDKILHPEKAQKYFQT